MLYVRAELQYLVLEDLDRADVKEGMQPRGGQEEGAGRQTRVYIHPPPTARRTKHSDQSRTWWPD
jgi:hypothetical protein